MGDWLIGFRSFALGIKPTMGAIAPIPSAAKIFTFVQILLFFVKIETEPAIFFHKYHAPSSC